MSADNAIYIRPLKNGNFAVKCISSLYPDELTDEEIDENFADLKEFSTLEDARKEVYRIYDEYEKSCWIIEYGHEILDRKDLTHANF